MVDRDDSTKKWLARLEEEAPPPKKHKKTEPFAVVHLAPAAAAYRAMNCTRAMVWLWLNHQARKTGKLAVAVPNGVLAKWGVGRDAKTVALRQLEAAGLITVERRPRKTPLVTLL